MPALSSRFEPLGPELFAVGEGPFRVRGMAFLAALRYVDGRLRGGRAAFLAALGAGDPFAPFYDQLFLASGEYDASPLLRLYVVVAPLEGVPVGRFIEQRARRSAEADARGVWKPMLKSSSPGEMAERTHLAFNRYFPPCTAATIAARPGRFEGELCKVPSVMSGLYTSATAGFFAGALAVAGAPDVRVDFEPPSPDGQLSGIVIDRVRFVATWRAV